MIYNQITGTAFVTLKDPWVECTTKYQYQLDSIVSFTNVIGNVEAPTEKKAREYGVRKKDYETTPTRERKARLSPAQRLLASKQKKR